MVFRYSYIKLIYDVVRKVRSHFLLLVALILLSGPDVFIGLKLLKYGVILLMLINVINPMIETFCTKIFFSQDGIHVQSGLLTKNEQFIPRDKLESIQTTASILQALFGAKKVLIETGDLTSTLTLPFVRNKQFPQMEYYVLQLNEDNEPSRQNLFEVSIKDIIKASFTSFSFLFLLFFGYRVFNDFEGVSEMSTTLLGRLPLFVTIILIIGAILLSFLIGFFITFNRYYRYMVTMDEERIYVQRGWLSTHRFSIRKERVQGVLYSQNMYQKLLGVTKIELLSTGDTLTTDDEEINALFSYMPTNKAHALIQQALPNFVQTDFTHFAAASAYRLIWLRPPIIACLITASGLLFTPLFFLGAATFIYTYVARIRTYKNVAYTLDDTHIQLRTGTFTVTTIVTKRIKLIELQMSQSIFQRKRDTYSFEIVNRSQPVHVTKVKDVELATKPLVTQWFEARTSDVRIDPRSQNRSLKDEVIIALASTLSVVARKKDI